MKEATLNKNVVAALNRIDGCLARKRSAHINNKGQPDVTGCIRGIRFELEGKLEGNRPTKIQRKRLREWEDAGAITGVYYSVAEAVQIVETGYWKRMHELRKIFNNKI